MNIIKAFNNTIDYLETVLDDEIDEKKVTLLSGYSYSMFSRLFSITSGKKKQHWFDIHGVEILYKNLPISFPIKSMLLL